MTYGHAQAQSRPFQLLLYAAGGVRTHDLRIKSPLLYQLSYSGGHLMIAHLTRRRPTPPDPQSTKATVSISTSIRGSIRALTSTIVIRGRTSPNAVPCARPTSSEREMSVT